MQMFQKNGPTVSRAEELLLEEAEARQRWRFEVVKPGLRCAHREQDANFFCLGSWEAELSCGVAAFGLWLWSTATMFLRGASNGSFLAGGRKNIGKQNTQLGQATPQPKGGQ